MTFIFILLSLSFLSDRSRVRVYIDKHEDVYEIAELGISIEYLRDEYFETHLRDKMIEKLREKGFHVEKLPTESYPESGYHSFSDMENELDSIVTAFPDIAYKFSIGTSVLGRELWVLKISDNVNIKESEPRIRYTGIIHGNEPIGCELLLRLADTLTSMYGVDSLFTYLVNNTEIYLMPMLNPDGRENSSRYNANGEDLNRDFPVPDGGSNWGSNPGMEVETEAMINWSDTMNFLESVTYHSGARIVNYVWDYTHNYPPFYELIRRISIGYAIRNPSIFENPSPSYADSGTIRGSEWYVVRGSLQDWAYDSTDCMDLTVELDTDKWPPATQLPGLWMDNRESMLWMIEHLGKGIRGTVLDSCTHEPVFCKYYISGEDKVFSNDYHDGSFFRPLLTGNYDITFESRGYITKTVTDISVNYDSTINLNLFLSPVDVAIEGTVIDDESIPLDSVYVEFNGEDFSYTDTTGYFSFDTYAGLATFKLKKDDYYVLRDTFETFSDTAVQYVLVDSASSYLSEFPVSEVSVTSRNLYMQRNFTLEFNVNRNDYYLISIIDVSGRIIKDVFRGHLDRGNYGFEIDIIQGSGIYFINIKNKDKCIINRKITIIE